MDKTKPDEPQKVTLVGASGYFNTLLEEISNLEKTKEHLKKHVGATFVLDPNFRLYHGKLIGLVGVAKDLAAILDIPIDKDFYPDVLGLMDNADNFETDKPQGPKSSDLHYYEQVDRIALEGAINFLHLVNDKARVSYSQGFIEKGTDFEREFCVVVSLRADYQNIDVFRSQSGGVFVPGLQAIIDVSNEF